jgi:hypothetical protein
MGGEMTEHEENKMHAMVVLCTVAPVALLLLALLDWPYVYYQVLRLVVSVCGVVLAYFHYDRVNKLDTIVLLLGCMVVVYNPIKGPSFKRATWEIVNVATAVLLVVKLVVEKRRTDSIERSETLK